MMKKLFEMVENNNYNELKQAVVLNQNINLSIEKSRCSLLYTSVKYRAKECFDILVEIPSVIAYENTIYQSALSVAVDYYINGRNQSNKYYIDRLVENKMTVHNVLFRSIKDKELFFYLYDKVNKTKIQFSQIIYMSLANRCMDVFECVVDTIFGLNQLGVINGTNIIYETLHEIIAKDNMEALGIFMKNNINIKQYSFLLYSAVKNGSINTFNYFYNYYSKLTKEELNAIPNVGYMHTILYDIFNNYNKENRINMLLRVFKLGINFTNVNASIIEFFMKSLSHYSSYTKCSLDTYGYEIINLFFENKQVTTNPLLNLSIPNFTNVVSRTFQNQIIQTNYMNTIAKFFDICMKYNYKPTDEVQLLLTKYKIPVKTN
jgi:hypothetical protein